MLLYNGRELDVSLALSPEELTRMRERGTEKTDKRNLYLAKEGSMSIYTSPEVHLDFDPRGGGGGGA